MEIVKNTTSLQINDLFKNNNILVIDIETDGLSHKNTIVIIGLIILIPNQMPTVIQLFNDDYHSEYDLLIELKKIIEEHEIDYFISFNGDSFDFPFINARFQHHHIHYLIPKLINIDLLRIAKKNKDRYPLDNYKLKTIEQSLGINRTDTISGKDSIVLYQAYLESKDQKLKQIILLHNYDDILNMIPLTKLLTLTNYSFPSIIKIDDKKIYILQTQINNETLKATIYLSIPRLHNEITKHTNYCSFHLSNQQGEINMDLVHFKDSNQSQYVFINPKVINLGEIYELEDSKKESLLIRFNDTVIYENINQIIHEFLKMVLI